MAIAIVASRDSLKLATSNSAFLLLLVFMKQNNTANLTEHNLSYLELDSDGYLLTPSLWSPEVAKFLAEREAVLLEPAHWEIITLLRDFYINYQIVPNNRAFVSWVRQNCGAKKGNSIYLLQLFSGNPVKQVARIAGLPRPTNCNV